MNNNVLGEEANDTSDGFALNRFPLFDYLNLFIYLFSGRVIIMNATIVHSCLLL